jgi:uncharacterized protein involved in exopolysaccharide biosynthesis
MSLDAVVTELFRRWRTILASAVVVAVLVCGVTLLRPRKWSASGSFVPSAGSASALSGLAGQFGITLPGDAGGLSPEFYADFLASSQVLKWVISADTAWGATPISVQEEVARTLEVSVEEPYRRQWKVAGLLRQRLNVRSDPLSGLVQFRVSIEDPVVAQRLAERFLQAVELFNAESRRKVAELEAAFSDARLSEAKARMDQADQRLSDFLARNRVVPPSGALALQQADLTREAGFAQSTYAALFQMTEQARLESQRSKVLIIRVESPSLPGIPDRRYLALRGVGSLLVGILLGILWVGGAVMLRTLGDTYPGIRDAFRQFLQEARGVFRRSEA